MGFPQKYILWFYLILGSSHIFLCFFFRYNDMIKSVKQMKIKFELRMAAADPGGGGVQLQKCLC